MFKKRSIMSFAFLLVAGLLISSLGFAQGVKVGEKMPAFALKDADGKSHSLADYAGKTVVIEFASQKCPWSRGADSELVKVAKAYEPKGVVFLAVDSHYATTADEIKAYAKEVGKHYPILKDVGNKYADEVKAMRTPEVFVVDKKGTVVYHGAFDSRVKPDAVGDKNYVVDVLNALEAGEPIKETEVAAWGCGIKRAPKEAKDNK